VRRPDPARSIVLALELVDSPAERRRLLAHFEAYCADLWRGLELWQAAPRAGEIGPDGRVPGRSKAPARVGSTGGES